MSNLSFSSVSGGNILFAKYSPTKMAEPIGHPGRLD